MEIIDTGKTKPLKMVKKNFNLQSLRKSLKFRPEIMKLILKMRQVIIKKTRLLKIMKKQLNKQHCIETISKSTQTELEIEDLSPLQNPECQQKNSIENCKSAEYQDVFTQTENETQSQSVVSPIPTEEPKTKEGSENSKLDSSEENNVASDKNGGWNLNSGSGENEKSIAEQVKEAAQSAMQQSGMVYVESAGMYYDYKTGYYYSSELGLYYHPDTGCYYRYSEDKQTFEFHSYPDRSKTASNTNALYEAHEKKKARKLKKGKEEDNENASKAKRRKKSLKKEKETEKTEKEQISIDSVAKENESVDNKEENESVDNKEENESVDDKKEVDKEIDKQDNAQDLEEGECSDSDNEKEEKMETDAESDESDASVSTVSDNDDSIAKHHPPCMRVIVRETNLPKLKVGSLFLVTKDGGTVGREGSGHTILIDDSNISRNHLDIQYDMSRKIYTVTDLGSKNGTTLNGVRISESQVISEPIEVMHGSTLQLGETKLLCHIHPGVDTCGHCEPGLVMEVQEKEKKVAYTRTCSVQKQHQLELARLKNKYAPQPLAIEEKEYKDRAKERRDKVGSSHHSEKTQSSDLDTFIAPENKGFKLLEKMGWSKGEGLGKDNQGDTEPVPLVNNEGKSGLGTIGGVAAPSIVPTMRPKNTLGSSTMRLAAKTKILQPPAKAFQDPLEEDSE